MSQESRLPRLLIITDRRQVPPGQRLASTVAAAASAGPCLIAVRERDLGAAQHTALAEEIAERIVNTTGRLATQLPAGAGVPAPRPAILGRSCHNTDELRRASADGCDYVTLSPVAISESKPGYGPPLGPDGLRSLIGSVPDHPPVYALGGVTTDNAATWIGSGAHGIAVMGSVMRADDPAAICAELHRALAANTVV